MLSLNKRIENASKQFSAEKLKHFITNIYKTDHQPSFFHFHQTADWIVNEFKGMGVSAKKIEFVADGKTKYSDWMLPKAWDAYDLKLKDLETGKIIADYQKISTHMVMGSGATPKEGSIGEVVYLEEPEEIETKDVYRKFILSKFIPQTLKKVALEKGALGFLFHGRLEDFQGGLVKWINSWSDDPALWSQTDKDIQIPAISLSPDMVDFYRDKILSGKTVRFEAKIDTKFYDGTLPVVEAFIPGELKEELFFTGHLFEQGANDNASGCATMMEIARAFSKTKPKRGLRFLFTSELYGTIPYTYENLDVLKNVIAGINIDSTAEVGRRSKKMDIIQNPNTNPSYVNVLIEEFVNASGKADQFEYQPFLLDDNMVTDPQINIPCFLIGVCSFNWHTSNDTLEIIDWDLFNLTTTMCIAWADFIVNGGEAEVKFLKDSCNKYLENWEVSLRNKTFDSTITDYREEFIAEVKQQFDTSINKLYPLTEPTPLTYNETGPIRNYFGPPSYGNIQPSDRVGLGMWSGAALFPQFWSNGKRSKERIVAYSALEFNMSAVKTTNIFNSLYKNNYLSDVINEKNLTIDMKKIGIKEGDIIIVHASMKKIGEKVDGGPEAVIQALFNAVGKNGTIVFPTFTVLNPKTELKTEPSRLGLLSEVFRKWHGAKRSNNPTHCVSAIGKHAAEIISGHEKLSQFGLNSPLHKASNMGAKVLHLGTSLKSCSLIHVGETIGKVPYMHIGYPGYDKEIVYISEDGEERIFNSVELPGDSNGFPKLLQLTKLEEKLNRSKIGNADSFLVLGKDLLFHTLEAIAVDPYSILCDNEKCSVCVASRKCKT